MTHNSDICFGGNSSGSLIWWLTHSLTPDRQHLSVILKMNPCTFQNVIEVFKVNMFCWHLKSSARGHSAEKVFSCAVRFEGKQPEASIGSFGNLVVIERLVLGQQQAGQRIVSKLSGKGPHTWSGSAFVQKLLLSSPYHSGEDQQITAACVHSLIDSWG